MSTYVARSGRSSGALQENTKVSEPSSQDDNHARFSRLVLPHLGDAYALAYRIMGSHADAEDALQETCLRAFRAVGDVVDLWQRRHAPIASHGHPGRAYRTGLALAEWRCRTADRIDPA
ncbi:sigma factor [Bradyrhizobium cenepequi]